MRKAPPKETPEERERRRCASCRALIGSPAKLKEGDMALCMACGSFNLVVKPVLDHKYRALTVDELAGFSVRDAVALGWLAKFRRQFKVWLDTQAKSKGK